MERTILHCDLNNFFASVELLDHPELRGQPVAVCGDPSSRHGIILAKNELAKAKKVQTAETIWQAQRKCPGLVLLLSHHSKYRHYSQRINAIYQRYTDLVEPFSIDESWLDVTGSLHLFGKDGRGLADELRAVVRSELGLTISVGVSFNKVFAKLGSDYKKPDATTVITRENFTDILWPLPVDDMIFVGRAARKVLNQYGIKTIGDLARADREALVTLMGKQGGQLSDYARGLDSSRVIPAGEQLPPKSVGNGLTFRRNLVGLEEVRTGLELLSDSVATRLRRKELKCTSVQVTIRDPNFKTITRQMGLNAPTYLAREITEAALILVQRNWDLRSPIRMLTVTGQNLISEWEAAEQMDLFAPAAAPKREKLERLEKAMDAIRTHYGKDSIMLGSLQNTNLKGEGKPE
ncbi:MAG: DNA polymerase IV [Clostridiales bacterium]|nr:DNA polymerase IV [Clostridiales bacterium]